MCPSPRPETIGTGTPAAAAIGARISEVLSPTPPVLCLSTFRPGVAERSTTEPDRIIASVRAAVSRVVHPPPEDRHQERRPLVIGHLARGDPARPSSRSRRRRGRAPSRFLRMMSTARMAIALRRGRRSGRRRAELAVAGVAQAGVDEADLVQPLVDRADVDRHVGHRLGRAGRSPRGRRSGRGT